MLTLYNSLSRSLETFTPLSPGKVGMYTCGPTVYSYAHIGNMRTYLMADLLKRVLLFSGYEVTHVMNITDVGHLVGDVDSGEDKLEKASKRSGYSVWDIAKHFSEACAKDMAALNLLPPNHMPRATDFIQEQIALVQLLEQKGFTYRTSDGIYFDTSLFPEYGKVSAMGQTGLREGVRVEVNPEKKNPSDFALWKFSYESGRDRDAVLDAGSPKREMEWPSPWGIGFPGWHIECSAMGHALLGQPFDIHTGGVDLRETHHANEIAQSEAAYDTSLATYWMHGEFILVDGKKMSKSLQNVYTVSDLVERGYDPLSYRYLLLTGHYRSEINFTFDSLTAAGSALAHLRAEVSTWDSATEQDATVMESFRAAVENDLNLPEAVGVMWDMVRSDIPSGVKRATLLEMDTVFGISVGEETFEVPGYIRAMLAEREVARASSNFELADALRHELLNQGFAVEDTAEGQRVKPAPIHR